MDEELKAKWVKALRSGEYRQGSHNLRCVWGDGRLEFCCLGVLAEISGCKWVFETPMIDGHSARHPHGSWLKDGTFGLDYSVQRELSKQNDAGWSFSEIADYIEARL